MLAGHLRGPLARDLGAFVEPDIHADGDGFYLVRSLYLDSPDWRCFHEKNAGLPLRHKLRVRGYVTGDTVVGSVKFEVKRRNGSHIQKLVAASGLDRYRALRESLLGGGLGERRQLADQPNLETFFRLKHAGHMRPVVNVQFRRQAFQARTDRRCRITIDDRLTARCSRDLLDTMTAAVPLLERNQSVLEIKVDQTLPLWIQRLIYKYGLQIASVSKYAYSVMSGPFGLEGTA